MSLIFHFLIRLFVPQTPQNSLYRRAKSDIWLAIPSTQSVCGMEIIMGINLTGLNAGLGDTYASLLGSANASSSGGMDTLLTDYASIKNGSYGKMMKSYYAKVNAEAGENTQNTQTTQNAEATKKNTEKDTLSASAAGSAHKTAEKISNLEITSSNRDDVYSAVSGFIKDYNELIKAATKSTNTSIQKQADLLTDTMYNNFRLFGNVGITLNEDRTLSVNEDSFKKAEIGTLKTLFSGMGSFADKVSAKASQIYRYANGGTPLTAKSYTSSGAYSNTISGSTAIDSTT